MNISQIIAEELKVQRNYVENVIGLLDEGNTIPFIARYRKEMHGSMDDTALRALYERLGYLRSLQERKESIKNSIEEQGKLTDELAEAIDTAMTLAVLEDLYRPYKQKKRTRASMAREKGLEPLAVEIMMQTDSEPAELAERYIDPSKGVEDVAAALQGASDIIAETVSDDAENRKLVRAYTEEHAVMTSKAAKEEDSVYSTIMISAGMFPSFRGIRCLL